MNEKRVRQNINVDLLDQRRRDYIDYRVASTRTEETWALGSGSYDEAKREAFIRAGVENTGNILRHSFASYLLTHSKNFEIVGYLMQHKNRSTTEGYEGIVKNGVDADWYFKITPSTSESRVIMPQ